MADETRHTDTRAVPDFFPHAYLNTNSLPYAGEVFDEPEEGDEIVIAGHWYSFEAHDFKGSDGNLYEEFGWTWMGPVAEPLSDEQQVQK